MESAVTLLVNSTGDLLFRTTTYKLSSEPILAAIASATFDHAPYIFAKPILQQFDWNTNSTTPSGPPVSPPRIPPTTPPATPTTTPPTSQTTPRTPTPTPTATPTASPPRTTPTPKPSPAPQGIGAIT